MTMEFTVARRDGSEAEQLAWDRLLTLATDYREFDALGRRTSATTVHLRAIGEFGDEQWEHALDYALRPSVRYAGEPGYVGGQQ